MAAAADALQAIRYSDGKLQLLDQRLLPLETVYLDVPDPQAAWQQIKVRGGGEGCCVARLRAMRSARKSARHTPQPVPSHHHSPPATKHHMRRTWWCAARPRLA
jgi:methylthioribose-1-phosphate isomerase